jgi:hypothetical protein
VDEAQVRRDHVISHCLAALTTIDDDRLTFFGGTALSRTRLPDLRLSEDIDLIARAPRTSTAQEIQDVLTTTLRPLIGTPIFEPMPRPRECVCSLGRPPWPRSCRRGRTEGHPEIYTTSGLSPHAVT